MQHWGEYQELYKTLKPALGAWWRKNGWPWIAPALAVGVGTALVYIVAISLALLPENRARPTYLVFSLIDYLVTLLTLWLWYRAARAADAALDGLDDIAKLKLVPSPGRRRFMAYVLQGIMPVCAWAVIRLATMAVYIVQRAEEPYFRVAPGFAHLDYLGRLVFDVVNPVELKLVPLLLVLGYIAFSRKWPVAFTTLWATLAAVVLGGILGYLPYFFRVEDSAVLGWSVPLAMSTLLGLAVLVALFWEARSGRTRLALVLFAICLAGSVLAFAHKRMLWTNPDVTLAPGHFELIALPGAPAEVVWTLPFQVGIVSKVDNTFLASRHLYFNWIEEYDNPASRGVPGVWTIYLALIGNLAWLALIYMAMLRYSDEGYTLERLKEEWAWVKQKADDLLKSGR